jgi:hypothetical protein
MPQRGRRRWRFHVGSLPAADSLEVAFRSPHPTTTTTTTIERAPNDASPESSSSLIYTALSSSPSGSINRSIDIEGDGFAF